MEKILLLGATGYVGSAFAAELRRRRLPFYSLTRKEADYTSFEVLWNHLREQRPSLVINAAGYRGKPNVDACETARAETLAGNTLFPQALAHACQAAGIPFGHVSSGCIYAGAKIEENGQTRIVADLTQPEHRGMIEEGLRRSPGGEISGPIRGFTENDPPNFSFRSPPCSFYSGTKALAEETIAPMDNGYLWRLRIPFDEAGDGNNFLAKIQSYPKVYDNVNSLSHRGDFARACLDLWKVRAPFGIYNVTNPGWVTTRWVVQQITKILKPDRKFEYWESDQEFYRFVKAPRSNCILDTGKLLSAGVAMRPVGEALEEALRSQAKG